LLLAWTRQQREQRDHHAGRHHQKRNHIRQLEALGYTVTLTAAA